MKRVIKTVRILFALLCISIARAGCLPVFSPLTLPHLKVLLGDGQRNLPNPIQIVKSFIPRPGCAFNCHNNNYGNQDQRRDDSFDHHSHGQYSHQTSYQPQFSSQQGFVQGYPQAQNQNWNDNHRPQQTYGGPFGNWQNSQQSYNPPMNQNHFMVNYNQGHFTNPSNTQFYHPRPGQPNIVETGYNQPSFQNYNQQIPTPQQNTFNQANIMEQTQFVPQHNNPTWQNLPNIMEASASSPWLNKPQNVQSNISPSGQQQPNVMGLSQTIFNNQPAKGESSTNPWENQEGFFISGANTTGPQIIETPVKSQPPPTTFNNQQNIINSIFHQTNSTNLPLLNSLTNNLTGNKNVPLTFSKSQPSVNPTQETTDFIYPDSARYVHKSSSELDASQLIDIRRR